ncbi:hypothetical protein GQ457_15G019550 [Hibiscus cannabinus]
MGKTLVHQMKVEKEMNGLGAIKKRWRTLHKNNLDRKCRQVKCPLTLKEAGLMLSALGYGSNTHIYVASNEVCEREETLRVQREFEVVSKGQKENISQVVALKQLDMT